MKPEMVGIRSVSPWVTSRAPSRPSVGLGNTFAASSAAWAMGTL